MFLIIIKHLNSRTFKNILTHYLSSVKYMTMVLVLSQLAKFYTGNITCDFFRMR